MSAAFFLNKQSSEEENEGELQSLLGKVRTMKDDLEEARHGKRETPPSQAERQETQGNLLQRRVFQKTGDPFGKEGEVTQETQAKAIGGQSGSPFGVAPARKSDLISNALQSPSLKNGLSGVVSDGGGILVNRPKKGSDALWVGVILIVAIALISGGVFYFFFQRNQIEIVAPPLPPEVVSNVPKEAVVSTPQDQLFVLDKPNYISFNTETVTPEDIKNTLFQTALRVKAAGITQPVEFLVTDQNNNPIAFSRFAFLFKIDPASDVLALVDEMFSLYVYNDDSRVHLGLALTFKDALAAGEAVAKAEMTLPHAFQALIFESDIPVPDTVPFGSGTYNQFAVRFANLSDNQNVSFDYAESGTRWFIGTSKNTLRAILDIYAKETSQTGS